ncbi:MAG: hypothetical protein QOH49_1064 [Acidobacteriota bacterium]|jgi:hypothetical protein|nr:hypothetical protein [Acidobacteriota bacterium]
MNDYLWDKKGEPDTEVARLEALLGAFAHTPRPLELPDEAATTEPSTARLLPFVSRLRASRLFAPAALAAALLVASILVASAFLRARVASEGERAVARETAQPKDDARKDKHPAPHEVVRRMLEPPPPEGGVTDGGKVERAAVANLLNGSRQRHDARLAAVTVRRPRLAPVEQAGAGVGFTLEAMSARDGASALVENARLLTKEQLVYALRLTGAKLRDVRERAQGTKAEARP